VEGLPRPMSTRGDDKEEGSKRANPGFVQPRHKKDTQDNRVASFLHVAGHAPTSVEEACCGSINPLINCRNGLLVTEGP
jgi:hypothetical protein